MRKTNGFTLLELLISVGMMAAVTYGCIKVLSVGLSYNEHLRAGRTVEQTRIQFEDRLTELIHHVYIDPVNKTNASTYFVGQTGEGMPPGQTIEPGQPVNPPPTSTLGSPVPAAAAAAGTAVGGTAVGSPGNGASGGDSDTLIFTALGRKISDSVLASTDDFETNNQNFGPQGGIGEFAISMTPVGDAQGKTGVVLREQIPADQDATQGGYENIIEPDVTNITFEFYDGTQWQPSWNTFEQTTRQLPSAIRVTYTMKGESQDRIMIVLIPQSNVTPNNPATMTGGS